MTLGEQIQELRREASLSQEALGEALGVSRQAISKWEGDIAIPEVDKLIAMSRLFQVPVGVLLGVEGEREETAAGEELSERELQAVETIVSRYLAQAQEKKPPRRRWPFVLAGVVLFFGIFNIFSRLEQMDSRLASLSGEVYGMSDNFYTQIHSLTGQIEEILSRQNSLVADWSWTVGQLLPQEDALVLDVSITPREYPAGLEVLVTAELTDGAVYTAQATHREGSGFSAALKVPRVDELKLSVVLVNGEVRQTQVLNELYGLRRETRLELRGDFGGTTSLEQPAYYIPGETVTAPMRWEGEVELHILAEPPEGIELYPVSAQLQVYKGTELMDAWPMDLESKAWQSGVGPHPFQYELEVRAGDEIRLLCRVEDNYGQITDFLIYDYRIRASESSAANLDVDIQYLNSIMQLDTPFGME